MNQEIKIATNLLKKHEGFRQFPYRCTANKLTIGYGLNLDDRGITKEEAEYLLVECIKDFPDKIRVIIKNFYALSINRQAVLIDMAYNLGVYGLRKFKNMIKAIEVLNFDKASDEMLDSQWAKQVGSRAKELSDIMRTNEL